MDSTQKPRSPGMYPVESVPLDEAAWQRWLEKGQQQEAAHRKRFIRALWIVLRVAAAALLAWLILVRGF